MNYGLPYKGSKNKLAPKIFKLFPRRKNFYDLFCGGCAMTHYGMLHNKFEKFFINDLNPMCPTLFMDAVNGKYKNEKRWISREDFFNSNEPYVKFVWSFGNNLCGYMYSEEIEPWKKALHYARVYKDFSLFEEMGIKLKTASSSEIRKNEKVIREKYVTWYVKKYFNSDKSIEQLKAILTDKNSKEKLRLYLVNALKKSGLTQSEVNRRNGNQMAKHYFCKSQWQFPTREEYQKIQEYLPLDKDYDEIYGLQCFLEKIYDVKHMNSLESLQRLQRLESLQRLERLERLQRLERLERLEQFSEDYQNVKIYKDSVIYCDIPYEGTDGYVEGSFDFERFYSWCEKQTEPLFISSYKMPEDRFVCIATFEHRSTLSAVANNKVLEKVFIPKHQASSYRLPGSLFNFAEM